MSHYKILICTNQRFNPKNPSCAASGSSELLAKLKQLAQQQQLDICIEEIKCFGQCQHAPVMRIAPGLDFFKEVNESHLPQIIEILKHANENLN